MKRRGEDKQGRHLALHALSPLARRTQVGSGERRSVAQDGSRRHRTARAQAVRVPHAARRAHPKTNTGKAQGQQTRRVQLWAQQTGHRRNRNSIPALKTQLPRPKVPVRRAGQRVSAALCGHCENVSPLCPACTNGGKNCSAVGTGWQCGGNAGGKQKEKGSPPCAKR